MNFTCDLHMCDLSPLILADSNLASHFSVQFEFLSSSSSCLNLTIVQWLSCIVFSLHSKCFIAFVITCLTKILFNLSSASLSLLKVLCRSEWISFKSFCSSFISAKKFSNSYLKSLIGFKCHYLFASESLKAFLTCHGVFSCTLALLCVV